MNKPSIPETGNNSTANFAEQYVKIGFALCPIPPVNGKPTKGPRVDGWNTPENAITSPAAARQYWEQHPSHNMGCIHGFSSPPTVAFDIDDVELTKLVFEGLGIDLDELTAGAPGTVGKPGRAKAWFKLPEELQGKVLSVVKLATADNKAVFELRTGRVQDVLPPSIHPDTGRPYEWKGPSPRDGFPELPAPLADMLQHWDKWKDTLESILPGWAPPQPARPAPRPAQGDGIIQQFNARYRVEEILERNGYKQKGKKWLSPTSETKAPGVSILPDGNVYSHHASDPLNDGRPHDPFDTARILEHGGDWKAATRDAAQQLGIEYRPPAPPPAQTSGEPARPQAWGKIQPLPEHGGEEQAAYPFESLPKALQRAALESARFQKVPVISPATIALSFLAVAIGKKAKISERDGLEHYPALFFSLIASSGERKSPPFKLLARPFERWIADNSGNQETATRRANAKNIVIDSAISALKQKAKKSDDLELISLEIADLESKRIAPPPSLRMFTTDITEQRLFQRMEEHNGEFAVLSGEGRQVFDNILGKYSGDGKTGDGIYLAGISGDTITRDRVGSGDGPEEGAIVTPCLNVCVMVQPDKYMEVARHPNLRASGALARIWAAWLPSLVGTRIEEKGESGLIENELAAYDKIIYDLLNAPLQENPHHARLSVDATEARRVLFNQIENLQGADKLLFDVRDIASKAVSQVTKLALILHISGNPYVLKTPESEVSIETWKAAQAIGMFHFTEAVRVQRMADENTALDMARTVLAWIKQKRITSVTSRKLAQFSPRPRPTGNQADTIIDILLDANYLREKPEPGKRKPVFEVNPELFT